jgi:hypothetical protein
MADALSVSLQSNNSIYLNNCDEITHASGACAFHHHSDADADAEADADLPRLRRIVRIAPIVGTCRDDVQF